MAEAMKKPVFPINLDDMLMGNTMPVAPMGTEPPEFFSDTENAGLGLAPMMAQAQQPQPLTPAMQIAIALQGMKQKGQQK